MSQIYTEKDLDKHRSTNSCWIVIEGKVYDVTKFLDEHPGGENTLLENAGKDSTEEFDEIGHSEDAKKKLKDFEIGIFKEDTKSDKPGKEEEKNKSSGSNGIPKLILFSIPVILLSIIFFFINKFVKKESEDEI